MSDAETHLIGTWQGSLEVGQGMKLPLVFKFEECSPGKFTGTLISPAQSPKPMNIDRITFDTSGKLVVEMESIHARYEGKLVADLHEFNGTFLQSGRPLPLVLERVSEYKPPHHRQDPIKPYPYTEKAVSFGKGQNIISGTLTLPSAEGSYPAAVLICGSGPHDRDETIFFHKPFLVLADYLTRHGIAVLRYDKRGCFESKGDYAAATTMDFAEDAEEAVKFLEKQEHIDVKKLGLIGHSEGGVIAPIVASRCDEVKFIVSLAGAAVSGEQILLGQIAALQRAGKDVDEQKIQETLDRAKKTYEIIKSEPDNKKAHEKMLELRGHQKDEEHSDAEINVLTGPWYRFFITFDPRKSWSGVKCPVLALNGDKDVQVLAGENLEAIKQALTLGGNKSLTEKEIHGVNHLFQTCKTGQPSEYADNDETIAPSVLEIIENWITNLH